MTCSMETSSEPCHPNSARLAGDSSIGQWIGHMLTTPLDEAEEPSVGRWSLQVSMGVQP